MQVSVTNLHKNLANCSFTHWMGFHICLSWNWAKIIRHETCSRPIIVLGLLHFVMLQRTHYKVLAACKGVGLAATALLWLANEHAHRVWYHFGEWKQILSHVHQPIRAKPLLHNVLRFIHKWYHTPCVYSLANQSEVVATSPPYHVMTSCRWGGGRRRARENKMASKWQAACQAVLCL